MNVQTVVKLHHKVLQEYGKRSEARRHPSLQLNAAVKELLKLLHICHSYRNKKCGTFLQPTVSIRTHPVGILPKSARCAAVQQTEHLFNLGFIRYNPQEF